MDFTDPTAFGNGSAEDKLNNVMNTPIIATYGHGTENDFLVVFDPEEEISITTSQTAAMCNRETGIGADGLIKIGKRDGKWFMDYRNADGSLAEMCGNGIRVMARYLVERGHHDEGEAVTASVEGKIWNGYHISVGDPHAVVFVEKIEDVGSLKDAPVVRPRDIYPEGVNVEFVEVTANKEIKMRVHERGSGETRSCGTGTCAVAFAATLHTNTSLPARWVIHPPGGRLVVDIDPHANATLIGPAVLIKDIDITNYLQDA